MNVISNICPLIGPNNKYGHLALGLKRVSMGYYVYKFFSHKWTGGSLVNKIAQKSVFHKDSKRLYGLSEYTCFSTSKVAPLKSYNLIFLNWSSRVI